MRTGVWTAAGAVNSASRVFSSSRGSSSCSVMALSLSSDRRAVSRAEARLGQRAWQILGVARNKICANDPLDRMPVAKPLAGIAVSYFERPGDKLRDQHDGRKASTF